MFRHISLLAKHCISDVLSTLIGEEDAFEEGAFDLAEDPYRLQKIDPITQLLILEVTSEGVVED